MSDLASLLVELAALSAGSYVRIKKKHDLWLVTAHVASGGPWERRAIDARHANLEIAMSDALARLRAAPRVRQQPDDRR